MKERRFVKGAEVRAVAESGHIDGHAAVFNEKYVLMDYPDLRVEEIIKPGAFSRAIQERQDVRALFNHDPNFVLGRTSNDTLTLKEDRTGLYFDNTPPDTQTGRDVRTLIDRGDITGCSFAFEVTKQTRREAMIDKQLVVTREVEDVNLYDVGPVTYPAYESTDVNARQIDFRGVFPNGYPVQLRKHLGDLGLPPDLQRKVPVTLKKRQITVDMTPEEMQSMIDDMETKMDDMTASVAAMQASMDAMEGKLTGAKEAQGDAEKNSAKSQQELVEVRAAYKEEKAGVAAWVKRTSVSLGEIVAACKAGLAEVHKRAQSAVAMHDKLRSCQERLVVIEKAFGEERALLTVPEPLPDWTELIGLLRESTKRDAAIVDKIVQRTSALRNLEKQLSEERTALQQIQDIDQNWALFQEDLQKVLNQSEEAARELDRRTRLWE